MTERVGEIKFFCPSCGRAYEEADEVCPEDGTPLQAYRLAGGGSDTLVGETLDGRFHIEDELGEGGMGQVYRSVQLSIDRDVALKVLHSDLGDDEGIVRRFFREARLIADCSHPNIVGVVDFGQDLEQGALYLAMEMVEGTDLRELFSMGRFSPELALEIIRQTCSALSEIHGRGIVHRDLKPENLMATLMSDRSVRIKVVDFGIAHALQADRQARLTETGMVYGTPTYMSPEQAEGREVEPTTDIYALGVILFELLTGQVLFEATNPMKTRFRHIRHEPPRLNDVLPSDEQHDTLDELLGAMLAKSPEGRPGDVLEVRDAIEAIQDDEGFDSPLRLGGKQQGWERFEPLMRERLTRTWGETSDSSQETDSAETRNRGTSTILSEARHTDAREIPPTQGFTAGGAPSNLLGNEESLPTSMEEDIAGEWSEGDADTGSPAESRVSRDGEQETASMPDDSVETVERDSPVPTEYGVVETAQTVEKPPQTPEAPEIEEGHEEHERATRTDETDEDDVARGTSATLVVGAGGLLLFGGLVAGVAWFGGGTRASTEGATSPVVSGEPRDGGDTRPARDLDTSSRSDSDRVRTRSTSNASKEETDHQIIRALDVRSSTYDGRSNAPSMDDSSRRDSQAGPDGDMAQEPSRDDGSTNRPTSSSSSDESTPDDESNDETLQVYPIE